MIVISATSQIKMLKNILNKTQFSVKICLDMLVYSYEIYTDLYYTHILHIKTGFDSNAGLFMLLYRLFLYENLLYFVLIIVRS